MVALTLLALAASLASFAAAELKITTPSASEWWVAQSVNIITWTCQESSHDSYTVLISNSDPKILSGNQAIIPIQKNVDCSKVITQDQSAHQPAPGYRILFGNPLNATEIYAQSDEFEIKPLGSSYPATSTPATGSPTGSGSAAGPSGTGSGATSLKTLGLGMSVGLAAGVAYIM